MHEEITPLFKLQQGNRERETANDSDSVIKASSNLCVGWLLFGVGIFGRSALVYGFLRHCVQHKYGRDKNWRDKEVGG
eukprot:SAG11_NODE_589_length_8326_cov_11.644099_6_plen_78_part_00